MTIRAVIFDMGGVIVRTEFQAPRQRLAERFGMEYDDLDRLVFGGELARQASTGQVSEAEQWAAVARRLHLPEAEIPAFRTDFFGGDVIDHALLGFIRRLRGQYKVGLISNAWSEMRTWIASQGIEQDFDAILISAEVGIAKPDARIYQLALEALGILSHEAVFVDDFIENVKGARAVGMQAIHFTQPGQALQELQDLLASPA